MRRACVDRLLSDNEALGHERQTVVGEQQVGDRVALGLNDDRLIGDIGQEAIDFTVDERRWVVFDGHLRHERWVDVVRGKQGIEESLVAARLHTDLLADEIFRRQDVATVRERQDREGVLLVGRSDDLERGIFFENDGSDRDRVRETYESVTRQHSCLGRRGTRCESHRAEACIRKITI